MPDEVWAQVKGAKKTIEQVINTQRDAARVKQEEHSLKLERDYLFEKANILEEGFIKTFAKQPENVEVYDIKPSGVSMGKETISISLCPDVHIEEGCLFLNLVLGINAFQPEIAKKRLNNYFINLVKLVSHHQRLLHKKAYYRAIRGYYRGRGFIHEELKQTNSNDTIRGYCLCKNLAC